MILVGEMTSMGRVILIPSTDWSFATSLTGGLSSNNTHFRLQIAILDGLPLFVSNGDIRVLLKAIELLHYLFVLSLFLVKGILEVCFRI